MASTTLWSWIFIFQLVFCAARPGYAAPVIVKHNYEVLVRRAMSRVFIRDEFSVSATKSAVILAVSISASVLLFACLLALFFVFRRSQQTKITESETEESAASQRPPWWVHETKNEKADWWWASPKGTPSHSRRSSRSDGDLRALADPAEYDLSQIPALVLNGKPLKAAPSRSRVTATRGQRYIGSPRSPAARRKNGTPKSSRHPFLPPKTPVEVLFSISPRSRPHPQHRRLAPPAPLKLRDHRPRKTNKVQRHAVSPLPSQLETIV